MLLGFLIASPRGGAVLAMMPLPSNIMQACSTQGGRLIHGSLLVSVAGFLVSTHTFYIHEVLHELGGSGGCSAYGVFDCGDVISNNQYNVDPALGLPWGVWGMFSFSALTFILLVIRNSLGDPNLDVWIKVGGVIPLVGMVPILWLIYVEVFELGKLCQYCSGAHLANVLSIVCLYWVYKSRESGEWSSSDQG